MNLSLPFTRANRMRALTVGVLALGILSVGVGRGTLAYFTTQVGSTGNTFTAGTLQLHIGDADQTNLTPSVATSITFANMKPGDTVYAPIEIDNVGSLDAVYGIKYATSTTGSQDLAPALTMGILGTGATGTGTTTATTLLATSCNETSFGAGTADGTVWTETIRATGTHLLAGSGLAGQVVEPVSSSTSLTTPNFTGLELAPAGGKDILCFQVSFPQGGDPGDLTHGDNVYNNTTIGSTNTTVVFTFDGLVSAAPQINNP